MIVCVIKTLKNHTLLKDLTRFLLWKMKNYLRALDFDQRKEYYITVVNKNLKL